MPIDAQVRDQTAANQLRKSGEGAGFGGQPVHQWLEGARDLDHDADVEPVDLDSGEVLGRLEVGLERGGEAADDGCRRRFLQQAPVLDPPDGKPAPAIGLPEGVEKNADLTLHLRRGQGYGDQRAHGGWNLGRHAPSLPTQDVAPPDELLLELGVRAVEAVAEELFQVVSLLWCRDHCHRWLVLPCQFRIGVVGPADPAARGPEMEEVEERQVQGRVARRRPPRRRCHRLDLRSLGPRLLEVGYRPPDQRHRRGPKEQPAEERLLGRGLASELGQDLVERLRYRLQDLVVGPVAHDVALGRVLEQPAAFHAGDEPERQVVELLGGDPDPLIENHQAGGPVLPVEASDDRRPRRRQLDPAVCFGQRLAAADPLAVEEDGQGRPAAALFEVEHLGDVLPQLEDETHQGGVAEAVLDVDPGAVDRVFRRRDLVAAGAHLQAGGAALDAQDPGLEGHRRVQSQGQLAPGGGLPAEEHRAVELLEVGGRERTAVEAHPHVVGVDLEARLAGSRQNRRLHQLEHVGTGIGELELPHLFERPIAVEGELAPRVELAAGAQLADQAPERIHLRSTAAVASRVSSSGVKRPRR